MKRLHINISVNNLDQSIAFYNALFNSAPTVVKPDYAKWLLDDPSVNFAISTGYEEQGLRHLGIQAENEKELEEVYQAIDKAEGKVLEEGHTICCYAKSEKSWIKDPQGIEWEAFRTYGESEVKKADLTKENADNCCEPNCC